MDFMSGGSFEAVHLPEDFMEVSPGAAKSVRPTVPNRMLSPFAADATCLDSRGRFIQFLRTVRAPCRVT